MNPNRRTTSGASSSRNSASDPLHSGAGRCHMAEQFPPTPSRIFKSFLNHHDPARLLRPRETAAPAPLCSLLRRSRVVGRCAHCSRLTPFAARPSEALASLAPPARPFGGALWLTVHSFTGRASPCRALTRFAREDTVRPFGGLPAVGRATRGFAARTIGGLLSVGRPTLASGTTLCSRRRSRRSHGQRDLRSR